MRMLPFNHSKLLILDSLLLSSAGVQATLMNKNYQYQATHTAFGDMLLLGLQTVAATVSSQLADTTHYELYIDPVYFVDITGDTGGMLIHADGYVAGIDRPVLFYLDFESDYVLVNADYSVVWELPVFRW